MTAPRNGAALFAYELEVIQQLMTGKSVKAIAAACGKSPQTITGRIKRVMHISGAKNHFQLGVWARDNGYVEAVVQATNRPAAAAVNPIEQHRSAA